MTNNLNLKSFIEPTGDAFSDVGGLVIKYLSEKLPEENKKDIFSLIEWITRVYIDNWNSNLHGFFLNSKITHNTMKNKPSEERINLIKGYYENLLKNKAQNNCRITGEIGVSVGGRDNMILVGSQKFINFNPFFNDTLFYSPEILIRNYFVPFGSIKLLGKYAIIHSANFDINYEIIKHICEENMTNIGSNSSSEVLESNYKYIAGALFDLIDKILINLNSNLNADFNLYHFSNFGASPTLELYYMPQNIFKFYSICNSEVYKNDWNKFLKSHHKIKKYHYDDTNDIYTDNKVTVNSCEYKQHLNLILSSLLQNKNLLYYFLKWSKSYSINFEIISIYQILIKNMNKKTIDKIIQLADFIVSDNDNLKKRLNRLEGSSKYVEMRSFLLSLIRKNYSQNNESDKVLITVEDYTKTLFPEDQPWAEIRDILLIAIYQKLHEKNIPIEVEPLNEIITEEENGKSN